MHDSCMGTWGPGIFSGDLAADVRGDWRDAILDGLTPEEAARRVQSAYVAAIHDEEDGPVFWIALSAAQAETGRLAPAVRDRALAIIDSGGDVSRFAEAGAAAGRQRERALARLAEKLRAPPRPPTKLRRPKPQLSPLAVGDVVRIRSENRSREALFVVVDHADAYPPGSTQPVVATLLWPGGHLPSADEMARLPLLLEEPQGPRRKPAVHLSAVICPVRGKLALENFGDIVARGVVRRDAPDYRRSGTRGGPALFYSSWLNLAAWVGGSWYERCVELTTREVGSRGGLFCRRP